MPTNPSLQAEGAAKLNAFENPTPAPTPAAPAPESTTSKVVGGVKSAAKSVGNFFEDVKSLGNKAQAAGSEVGAAVTSAIKLNIDANKTNQQTTKIAAEVHAASQLKTKQQRQQAITKIGTPSKYISQSDMDNVTKLYNDIGVDPTDNKFTIFKKTLEKVPVVGQSVQQFVDAGDLAKAGDIIVKVDSGKQVSQSDISFLDSLSDSMGLKQGDDTLTTLRKSLPTILNAAFAVTTVADPLVSVGREAIGAAAVKTAAGAALADVGDAEAKTVGEQILDDDPTARKSLYAQTKQGIQLLSKTSAGKLIGGAINSGISNASISLINQWSEGNNFSTPEERDTAFKQAGISFIQGAVQGATFESVPYLSDRSKEQNDALQSAASDLQDSYKGVLIATRLQQLDEVTGLNAQEDQLARGRATQESNRVSQAEDALKEQVKNTPVYSSHDEAIQALGEKYGVETTAKEPGVQTPSGFKRNKNGGYTLTYKKGDLKDAMDQVTKMVPYILKNTGVDYRAFGDELGDGTGLGIKELDSPMAKMQTAMSGLFTDADEATRAKYPKLSAAFDSVYGVINKVTPKEAAQNYIRETMPKYYDDLSHAIKIESASVGQDPITGKSILIPDPTKEEKLILDAQETILKDKTSSKTTAGNLIRQTVQQVEQASDLRDQAAVLAKQDGKTDAFQKADIASSTLTPNQRIQFWKDHIKFFHGKDVTSTATGPQLPAAELSDVSEDVNKPADVVGIQQPDVNKVEEKTTVENPASFPAKGSDEPKSKMFQKLKDSYGIKEDGPTYTKEVQEEEMKKAVTYATDDYDNAVKTALGGDVPEGFNNKQSARQYISAAVRMEAVSRGDDAVVNMTLSEASMQATEAAKTLSSVNFVENLNSTDGVLKAARKQLEAQNEDFLKPGKDGKAPIDKAVDDLKSQLSSGKLTQDEVSKKIDDLTC